jgi:hypothetical protein
MRLGKYQHYKGDLYEVIGVAKHSETLEDLVVYKCLYKNPESELWVRPKKIFLDDVSIKGKRIPRFKFVNPL